jgi:hypothetical protein
MEGRSWSRREGRTEVGLRREMGRDVTAHVKGSRLVFKVMSVTTTRVAAATWTGPRRDCSCDVKWGCEREQAAAAQSGERDDSRGCSYDVAGPRREWGCEREQAFLGAPWARCPYLQVNRPRDASSNPNEFTLPLRPSISFLISAWIKPSVEAFRFTLSRSSTKFELSCCRH